MTLRKVPASDRQAQPRFVCQLEGISKALTRVRKFRRLAVIIIVGGLLTGGIYYLLFHSELMAIDACPDAGGRWLESEKRCVTLKACHRNVPL